MALHVAEDLVLEDLVNLGRSLHGHDPISELLMPIEVVLVKHPLRVLDDSIDISLQFLELRNRLGRASVLDRLFLVEKIFGCLFLFPRYLSLFLLDASKRAVQMLDFPQVLLLHLLSLLLLRDLNFLDVDRVDCRGCLILYHFEVPDEVLRENFKGVDDHFENPVDALVCEIQLELYKVASHIEVDPVEFLNHFPAEFDKECFIFS